MTIYAAWVCYVRFGENVRTTKVCRPAGENRSVSFRFSEVNTYAGRVMCVPETEERPRGRGGSLPGEEKSGDIVIGVAVVMSLRCRKGQDTSVAALYDEQSAFFHCDEGAVSRDLVGDRELIGPFEFRSLEGILYPVDLHALYDRIDREE